MHFCDAEGNPVCWSFPLILNCNRDCEEKDGDGRTKGRSSDISNTLVYPNPASDLIMVEYLSAAPYTVTIIDQIGRRVYTALHTEAITPIDTKALSSGIHFIEIIDYEGTSVMVEKVLILKQ